MYLCIYLVELLVEIAELRNFRHERLVHHEGRLQQRWAARWQKVHRVGDQRLKRSCKKWCVCQVRVNPKKKLQKRCCVTMCLRLCVLKRGESKFIPMYAAASSRATTGSASRRRSAPKKTLHKSGVRVNP